MTDTPTNRTIDDRVARVEDGQKALARAQELQGLDIAALKTTVEVIRAEQGHLAQLITATASEARTAAALLGSKIDNLGLQAANRAGVDLKSDEEFVKLSKSVADHQTLLDRMSGMGMFVKFAVGGSLVGLAVGLITLYRSINGG